MAPVLVRRATVPWGAGLLLALVLAIASAAPGCGRSGGVDRAEFERSLVERQHVTPAQARCVSRYVYAAYRPGEIRIIHDRGLTALPSPRWAEYGHAMVGCLFHDQLADARVARSSAPSSSVAPTTPAPGEPSTPGTPGQ